MIFQNINYKKLLPHYNNEIAILSLTANLNIIDALAFNIPHYSVASILISSDLYVDLSITQR